MIDFLTSVDWLPGVVAALGLAVPAAVVGRLERRRRRRATRAGW